MIVKFPRWEPDAPFQSPEVLGDNVGHTNVVPVADGYRAIREAVDITSSGTVDDGDTIIGAFSAKDEFRTVDYFGDSAKLYAMDSATYTISDISNGTYTAQTGDFWDFAQYGTQVIAVNGGQSSSDTPQVIDTTGAVTGTAAVLGGSPPKAATVTTLRDFVVMGNTYDATDGARPGRVWWSGFGSATLWTPDAATQSDFQDLQSDVGAVQRVLGGEDVFIACQNGVFVMRYEGPPTVMRFDLVHPNIGTVYPLSAVRVGEYLYMYAKQGFVRLGTAKGDVAYFGAGRVNDTFLSAVIAQNAGAQGDRLQVVGAHDPYNQCIWWLIGTAAYGYSYALDRWTLISGALDFLYTSDIGYATTNARTPTIYGFDAGNSVSGYIGNDTESYTLYTAALQLTPGRRTLVTRVRPIVEHETSDGTMRLDTNVYNDPVNQGTGLASSQSNLTLNTTTGHFDVLTEGRWIQFVLYATGTQGQQQINGLDIEQAASQGIF